MAGEGWCRECRGGVRARLLGLECGGEGTVMGTDDGWWRLAIGGF